MLITNGSSIKRSCILDQNCTLIFNKKCKTYITNSKQRKLDDKTKLSQIQQSALHYCSGRNNTDLVGVTWPRAGAQKSRVGQEQYPRIAGQIAIWASGGSESGSERPPAAPRSIVVRETMASAP
ncbi:conserved hypothetical protein [Trichinella spiralis]|uniref:hypothetical protein n=1 Tax=Trichinella spiralis TaxID=6334 RepID=UPI0001EFEE07|nr:conserved hypothetical protein [Trichinella spiralis]